MIEVLKEVTEWEDNIPNHTYYVKKKDGKLVAYIKKGTEEVHVFKHAMPFYKTRRKFKKLGEVDFL